MRFIFYSISGIVSALVAWNLSQILLLGSGESLGKGLLPFPDNVPPEVILFPVVAACLAIAMVTTEIFLSNPTRHKSNLRVLPPYFWAAMATGVVSGLLASALSWLLYQVNVPAPIIRIISWSIIGVFTGLGEGISWRFRTIEGATKRGIQRIGKSTLYGLGAGFFAALIVETIRKSLGGYEDPVGFFILGLFLGSFLSFATSPTYQVALRAGEGFEAIDPKYPKDRSDRPRLNSPDINFVIGSQPFIEEGLSIQLPAVIPTAIIIGSDPDAHIYIPDIPWQAASLQTENRNITLCCLTEKAVQIQTRYLIEGSRNIPLRHNQILTFYHADDSSKYYRFVFYDRFLDPEA
ncbi:MAG: hypothetical protein WBB28_04215 [Crinalium sp.]